MRKPSWLPKETWEKCREHNQAHARVSEEEAMAFLVMAGLGVAKTMHSFWNQFLMKPDQVSFLIVPKAHEAQANQLLRQCKVPTYDLKQGLLLDKEDESPF